MFNLRFTQLTLGRDGNSANLGEIAALYVFGEIREDAETGEKYVGRVDITRENMTQVRNAWRFIARMNGMSDKFGPRGDAERGPLAGRTIVVPDLRPNIEDREVHAFFGQSDFDNVLP